MNNKYHLAGIFALLVLLIALMMIRTNKGLRLPLSVEQQREYANELVNKELYTQAVAAYDRYVETASLNPEAVANIDYIVGNIYMDRLRDYENAMARYLRVKRLAPQSKLLGEVNRRIVECLERLNRSLDAQQEMTRATALHDEQRREDVDGVVVAEIEGRKITWEEIENLLEQLPPPMRPELDDREAKLDFIKQYVVTELLYDTAKRKGYDRSREIVEQVFQFEKGLMVQRLLKEEIEGEIQVDEDEAKLYYEAHKDTYRVKEGDHEKQLEFDQAKEQVINDLADERQRKAYEKLMERMVTAEEVTIYEDRIR